MPSNMGHILTDDVVVNYTKTDRDDCLHFLTHLDTSCRDLALLVSPTAKRIYTSIFNAWFLKMNFDVKHIDIQGFDTNKSYKITYKGNKYIYSFIESKFTTGSVVLLLHGSFGTYLYTGNFCYYPSFLKSPVLLPVIEEKALTRLYLDNTYYEQPSNFLGFHELTTKVAEMIKSQPFKNFYIYADKITMDPLLADIASKLEEKVYVCQSTMEIMKILGYESCFTRNANESRIFIDKAFIKKRGFALENIAIYINRYSESCKSFQKIDKKGNVYTFNFYCHSNHKEICELLRILKPESMTFLFSEIDKSKLTYDFKFKYDFPRTVLFKGPSTELSNKAEGEKNKSMKNISSQLTKPTVNVDKTAGTCKTSGNEGILFSDNQDLSIINANNEGKNLVLSKFVSHDTTEKYIGPLRIRKVPEINSTGLSTELNCTLENGINKGLQDVTRKNGLYNCSNEINITDKNTSNYNARSQYSSDNFFNNQQNISVDLDKVPNQESVGSILIPSNIKSLSSCIAKIKKDMPLVINPRLVPENESNGTKTKIMQLSNIEVMSDGKKKTVLVNRKYVDIKKTHLIEVPSNDIKKQKQNYILQNGKHILLKKPIRLLKTKPFDSNSNIKRPNALLQPHSNKLNLTKLFHGWMDKNAVMASNLNSPSQKSLNVDGLEEPLSVEPQNSNQNNIELQFLKNDSVDKSRNSDFLVESDYPITGQDINRSSGMPTEFQLNGFEPSGNEKSVENNSSTTNSENSLINDKETTLSTCKLTDTSQLEIVSKNTEKNNDNECCQDTSQETSNADTKRNLTDEENVQLRKKLRSDNITQSLLQKNRKEHKPFLTADCSVIVKKNGFERSYFYSSHHNCYFPKFYGFKKNELGSRATSITLRNLHKLLEKL